MPGQPDILVLGTGSFAARIVFDLAATASRPISVAIAGRNRERLAWLRTAANARAVVFGRSAIFFTRIVDLLAHDDVVALIGRDRPTVIVQAASPQASSVIGTRGDAWSKLVAEGGLSATAVFQALLSTRVAQALRDTGIDCHFINCCFPDVVNSLIAAANLPVSCGVGNIAILSNAFAGELQIRDHGALKVLAHYQTIAPFRLPPTARRGPAPRAWIGDSEVSEVFRTFAAVSITPEPAIEISGASGVPLMIAMAAGDTWGGHVPGPNGLPGGYPVVFRRGMIELDLPPSLKRDEAIAWNARFEEINGLTVGGDGFVRYTGVLREKLHQISRAVQRLSHRRSRVRPQRYGGSESTALRSSGRLAPRTGQTLHPTLATARRRSSSAATTNTVTKTRMNDDTAASVGFTCRSTSFHI